jgi:hypothetical protein
MKSITRHLAFSFVILIILSSFKSTKRNSIANGSGMADGISFVFNAVEQKSGVVVGYIHYGDNDYTVSCATWTENYAILYTTDGHAFYVCDNGKSSSPDWMSDPVPAQCGQQLWASDFYGLHNVGTGNIQVKQ